MTSEPTVPRIIAVSERFRRELLAGEREAATRMVNAYGQVWARLYPRLDALTQQIAAREAAGQEVNPDWLRRQVRYTELLQQIVGELGRFSAYADLEVQAGQQRFVAAAIGHAEELTANALPPGLSLRDLAEVGIAWNRLPTEAVQDLVGRLGDGSPLRTLLDNIPGQVTLGVSDALINGLAQGWGPRKTADVARRETGMGLAQALRISRTEILRSYRTAQRRQYEMNARLVPKWRRHAAKNSRTCLACLLLDGKEYNSSEDMDDHPNGRCHPAGTLTSGPKPLAASARHYVGELVTIRTASGKELSFTPNHPILTPHGWVSGGSLVEGSYVVCSTLGEDAATAIHKDDYQMPTRIEQIAGALSVVSLEMPCAAVDFHGDGVGSEVYAVRTDGLLWDGRDATFGQPALQQHFGRRTVLGQLLSNLGTLALFSHGHLAPASGLARSLHDTLVFLGRALGRHQAVCFGHGTDGNTGILEAPTNSCARSVQCLGDFILRFARLITGHDFIIRQASSGHPGLSHLARLGLMPVHRFLANCPRGRSNEVKNLHAVVLQNALDGLRRCAKAFTQFGKALPLLVQGHGFSFPCWPLTRLSPVLDGAALIDYQGTDSLIAHSIASGQFSHCFASHVAADRVAGVNGADFSQAGGLSLRADGHTSLGERALEGVEVEPHILADVRQWLTGRVALDRVVELRRVNFDGHVYNLQTQVGWYIANGIIAHNCAMVPVPISYRDLGIPVDVPPITWEQGKDWFRRQPEGVQAEMMGGSLFRAWKDGKIRLEQLPKKHTDATWGPSWTMASLKDLGIDWRLLKGDAA